MRQPSVKNSELGGKQKSGINWVENIFSLPPKKTTTGVNLTCVNNNNSFGGKDLVKIR